MTPTEKTIHEIINRETKAWDEKSVELLLSIFHPDMVWVWPTDAKNIDPMSWATMMGKFNYERWSKSYQDWFSTYELIYNNRITQKIVVTKELDGAFAIVDVDTLWKAKNGEVSHWKGRTCKTYVLTSYDEWKMIAQVGVLEF